MKKYSKYIIINFINDKGKDYLIYVINFDYENRFFTSLINYQIL